MGNLHSCSLAEQPKTLSSLSVLYLTEVHRSTLFSIDEQYSDAQMHVAYSTIGRFIHCVRWSTSFSSLQRECQHAADEQ